MKTLLRRAIKFHKKAIKGLRDNNEPNLGMALFNLAAIEWHVYRYKIEIETPVEVSSPRRLQDVITLSKEALTIWENHVPKPESYPTLLAILAAAYRERFMKSASEAHQAIRHYEDVWNPTPEANRNHIGATMQMGITYLCLRPETDGQIESAIQSLTKARNLCENENDNDIRYICLYTLALVYHHRFEKQATPNNEDLTKAINFYRGMLDITSRREDAGYAKGLWALPMLRFHKYAQDAQEGAADLPNIKVEAKTAHDHPDITNEQQLQQLQAVCDFSGTANTETTAQSDIKFPSLTDADLYQQLTALPIDAVLNTVMMEEATANT